MAHTVMAGRFVLNQLNNDREIRRLFANWRRGSETDLELNYPNPQPLRGWMAQSKCAYPVYIQITLGFTLRILKGEIKLPRLATRCEPIKTSGLNALLCASRCAGASGVPVHYSRELSEKPRQCPGL